jgi:hypothetical protein
MGGCAVKPKVRIQQIDDTARQPTHNIDVYSDLSEINREFRRIALLYADDQWLIEKEKTSVDDLIDLMIAETQKLGADGLILHNLNEIEHRYRPSKNYNTTIQLPARGEESIKIIIEGIAIIYTD